MSMLEKRPWKDSMWQALENCIPGEVCTRSLAEYSPEGCYSLICMNSHISVNPKTQFIGSDAVDKAVIHPEFELLLLSYLINSKDIPLSGKWISEKEIPGGSMFFRGPHRLPAPEFEQAFGGDSGAFRSRGKDLGGSEESFGDVSIRLTVLPRIPVTIVLWSGDDEFPPRCHFLFDSSIHYHFPLDAVLALVNTIMRKFLDSI